MKQSTFCLIMALFWTVVCAAAAWVVISIGAVNTWSILILALAVACTCMQWMRYKNAKRESKK